MKRLVTSLLFLTFVGCKTAPHKDVSFTPHEESSDLLLSEANERHERLSNVSYDLKVDLTHVNPEIFSASLTLRFDLRDNAKNLRLDFFEGEVSSLEINNQLADLGAKKKYWIELPAQLLRVGANKINISYEQKYSKTGQGLHRFEDPETKESFIYTKFEPNDAQRFLPCFDQPDLRSNFSLSVVTPQGWQAISAVKESSKITLKKDKKDLWIFPPSPQISTYLFSLHAGPFKKFTDSYQRTSTESVPLRIFVRPSLAKYLKVKEWFTITKQGMGFYEKYFGIKYPFAKYDQLIVPEFNSGGMENVAAISYSERTISRSEPTRKMRRNTAGLLLHEMAHMWFGDLVTMAWWNDLWLNESFATYMASKAVTNATEFKEEWQNFTANTKRFAYIQDAMITTHPIEANVLRTKEATSTFDGITYNKGASVLKQLSYYMTEDSFQKGIQQYFKDYSYKNTTLKDFIGSLQNQTNKDLKLWAERWLRQSGTDQLAAQWQCDGNTLKQVNLTLTPTPGKNFRPQTFEIGLFKKNEGQLKLTQTIHAEVTGPEPLKIQGSWTCPDFVYPNFGDHGYVHVQLDPLSLQQLTHELSHLQDPLTRTLVWNDLWRMTRETQIPLKKYIEIISENFNGENDEIILQQVVSTLARSGSSVLFYWPQETEVQRAERLQFLIKMETAFLDRLTKSSPGSNEEKFWYDNFASLAESPAAIDKLAFFFSQDKVSAKLPLDLDRKWAIAQSLMRFQHPQASQVFATMKLKDHSDRGRKTALSVEASAPDKSLKTSWVQKLTSDNSKTSLQDMQAVLFALFPREQSSLKLSFENDFYNFFDRMKASEDELKSQAVLYGMIPLDCKSSLSSKLKGKLAESQAVNPSLRKGLMMSLDEDERCQRIRAGY